MRRNSSRYSTNSSRFIAALHLLVWTSARVIDREIDSYSETRCTLRRSNCASFRCAALFGGGAAAQKAFGLARELAARQHDPPLAGQADQADVGAHARD